MIVYQLPFQLHPLHERNDITCIVLHLHEDFHEMVITGLFLWYCSRNFDENICEMALWPISTSLHVYFPLWSYATFFFVHRGWNFCTPLVEPQIMLRRRYSVNVTQQHVMMLYNQDNTILFLFIIIFVHCISLNFSLCEEFTFSIFLLARRNKLG